MHLMSQQQLNDLTEAVQKANEALRNLAKAWFDMHAEALKQLIAWVNRVQTYYREELMPIEAWENEGGSLIHYTRERVYVF